MLSICATGVTAWWKSSLSVTNSFEDGVKKFKTVAGTIDTIKMKESSFLMVLTGTSLYAYQCEDGVYVVPIMALKKWGSEN